MSLILIIFSLYYNHSQFLIGSVALIAPFSIDKISFTDEVDSTLVLDGSVDEKLF